MILLITPFAKSQQCAEAIQQATGEMVQVAPALRQAVAQLREQQYTAVVMDQLALEAEPEECELITEHLESAIPVHVNFAISGAERVIREIRAALHRRKKEAQTARAEAEAALRNELKGTVTALLLSCELALDVPGLPAQAEEKLRAGHDLARELSSKLRLSDAVPAQR